MSAPKAGRPLLGFKKRVRKSFTISPDSLAKIDMIAAIYKLSHGQAVDYLADIALLPTQTQDTTRNIAAFYKDLLILCGRYKVKKIALFGSSLTKGLGKGHDIDLLVEFDNYTPSLFEMTEFETALSQVFNGAVVDLRTSADLSPLFRNKVLAEAQTLYAK